MNFSMATILTILTGTAFEKGLGNAKQLIEHMTGEEATELTFVTGGRLDICRTELLRQYPDLKWVWLDNSIGVTKDNYLDCIKRAEKKMGAKELFIEPIENMPTPSEYLSSL